jgi:hypothetical protein
VKLSSMERYAVALGLVLFLGGFAEVLWPHVGLVPHETTGRYGDTWGSMELMTRNRARAGGVLAMAAGAGIIAFTVYEKE